jgi:hypothetical protein
MRMVQTFALFQEVLLLSHFCNKWQSHRMLFLWAYAMSLPIAFRYPALNLNYLKTIIVLKIILWSEIMKVKNGIDYV